MFSASDESKKSGLRITTDALSGTSATIDYNQDPRSILVGFDSSGVEIQLADDEWNSGEEVRVVLIDGDANRNTRADEDLDLFNANVVRIPSIQIGNPTTLENLTSAELGDFNVIIDQVQPISQRAMLRIGSSDQVVHDGATLRLTLSSTFSQLYESIHNPVGPFSGFNFFNYDVRSFSNTVRQYGGSLTFVDIQITDGHKIVEFQSVDGQGLLSFDTAVGDDLFSMDVNAVVTIVFVFHASANATLPTNTVLPIVCDFFSFGKINDGTTSTERISNMIARLELEETGDNTSEFQGDLKFTLLNQLNISDRSTYEELETIGDDVELIIPQGLTKLESIQVRYQDLNSDGLFQSISDQLGAHAHHGVCILGFRFLQRWAGSYHSARRS